MNLYRDHNRIIYIENSDYPDELKQVLRYVIESYSFLMFPRRTFTAAELAETIEAAYDQGNPVNRTAVQVLEFVQANP